MGLRREALRLGSAVHRIGGRQAVGDGHVILTCGPVPGAAGKVVVTCQGPHGLSGFVLITVSGTGLYDGDKELDTTINPGILTDPARQFQLREGGTGVANVGSTTGGRWDLR
jgi:hypothetical protein